MSNFSELPKAYDPSSVEDGMYAEWEASGVFQPQGEGDPFCIVMPPPNRTGTLHMGHATMLAIEDVMIRFQRMQGKRALWIPGTDHAAIATQVKVEQLLIKQGMKDPRKELGREKFLSEVVAFAEASAMTIRNQVRKMGSSCDWTKEKYTFDEERNRAVNEMFKMMYDDGIIERGYRIVNWDPQFQTTLSDDEVLTKEVTAKLLTFKYDKDFPIAISTTRPETKFGDTAVAVHPSDERYHQYIGQTFTPVFCGKQLSITIVADEAVDPAFGTGALGVTPAHSLIDAEIAVKHGLETVQVIGQDGRLNEDVGTGFAGLAIVEARKKIEQTLNEAGLLVSVAEVAQNLPVAERGGAPVEQLPMRQWFVRVNKSFALRQDTLGKWKKGERVTLKELMIEAVKSGQTNIVPERFSKTYYHWIENLRDWCISRQIWFGHRIPVWYKDEDTQCAPIAPGPGWEQDPDTLDTWFSAGLWTFSTLGWPNVKEWEKNKAFHPTAVLETGYDILFFWVARMILMSTYALGEVPFKDVYLHGLVRDEQGRKMSKSLGNILDPLDLIPKYGTDAVRLSLLMGTTPGQDMKLSEQKIEGFRNFTNKLWNISRFILTQMGDGVGAHAMRPGVDAKDGGRVAHAPTLADRWILSRLDEVTASVTKKIESYEFSTAGEELRDFTWSDVADWYLEIAKIEKGKEVILAHLLNTILKLWHPFTPFVTEYIWKLAGFSGQLIVAPWPTVGAHAMRPGVEANDFDRFQDIQEIVNAARRLRTDHKIAWSGMIDLRVFGYGVVSEEDCHIIAALTKASAISFDETKDSERLFSVATSKGSVGVFAPEVVDEAGEALKVQQELKEAEAYLQSLDGKLANVEFTSKAPAKIVDGLRAKREETVQKIQVLKEREAKFA